MVKPATLHTPHINHLSVNISTKSWWIVDLSFNKQLTNIVSNIEKIHQGIHWLIVNLSVDNTIVHIIRSNYMLLWTASCDFVSNQVGRITTIIFATFEDNLPIVGLLIRYNPKCDKQLIFFKSRDKWICETYFSFNHLHPNISMHILHTCLYAFPKVLSRRIIVAIKSCFSWYCKEKLDASHSKKLKG